MREEREQSSEGRQKGQEKTPGTLAEVGRQEDSE